MASAPPASRPGRRRAGRPGQHACGAVGLAQYGPAVTKPDIFYYVYALLHAPDYRARYAENLKRDLPRIPLAVLTPQPPSLIRSQSLTGKGEPEGEDVLSHPFLSLASAGRALAALHVNYETADEYPLTQVVNKDAAPSWRVTRMKLNKDRTAVIVNNSLTLAGIPPEALDYKLGNRSALEWVIDQYQTGTDKRSGLTSDPNRPDDPEYIARLVGRVVTVSVQTVKIVNSLPPCTGYAPPCTGYAPPCTGYAPPCTGYAPPCTGYAPPCTGKAPESTVDAFFALAARNRV